MSEYEHCIQLTFKSDLSAHDEVEALLDLLLPAKDDLEVRVVRWSRVEGS